MNSYDYREVQPAPQVEKGGVSAIPRQARNDLRPKSWTKKERNEIQSNDCDHAKRAGCKRQKECL